MLVNSTRPYQGSANHDPERISDLWPRQCAQWNAVTGQRLPIIDSVESVAQKEAPMDILDLSVEVRFRQAVRHANEPGGARVAEEIAIHLPQRDDVPATECPHDGPKARKPHLSPPPSCLIDLRRKSLLLCGTDVCRANPFENLRVFG